MRSIQELEILIDYCFSDKHFIRLALTRRSYAIEHNEKEYNQRLEFLGDSVLGLTIAEELYKRLPNVPEGQLTKLKAAVVCEKSLAVVANELDIPSFIYIGKGELNLNIQHLDSTTSDTLEAIFGAVYLDSGFEVAKKLILRLMEKQIQLSISQINQTDSKTALQEIVQKKSKVDLEYVLVSESGPEHNKRFVSKVIHMGRTLGVGEGRTKKEAEKMAASNAIRDYAKEYK